MKITMDNTSAGAAERCPEYYHNRHELNLVPIAISVPLTFGGAFHKGLQTYYDKNRDVVEACADFSLAFEQSEGLDKKRTKAKGHELLLAYHEQFKDEPWLDKKGEVEFNLPLAKICPDCHIHFDPYSDVEMCSCLVGGELLEIWYSGIIDRTGLFHGDWTIHEFKTSSSPRDFVVRPNNQITGYVWGAQELLGQPFKNSLVTIAGVFKTSEKGYYVTNAGGSKSTISVMTRHFTPRSSTEISDFKQRVVEDALRIYGYRASGVWPKWTDSCAYKYGLCPYQPLCNVEEKQRAFLVETAYRVEPWTPGKRPVNE